MTRSVLEPPGRPGGGRGRADEEAGGVTTEQEAQPLGHQVGEGASTPCRERTDRSGARGRAWPWRTSVSSIRLYYQSPAAALRDRLRRVDAASIETAGGNAFDPVAGLLAGRQRTGQAEVIEDRAAVLAEVDHLVVRYSRKGAGQRIGVVLDTTPPPTGEALALAMRGHVVIRLVLDGMPARGGAGRPQ